MSGSEEPRYIDNCVDSTNEIKYTLSVLNSIIDSTGRGILVVNCEGKITKYNKKFMKLWSVPQYLLDKQDDVEVVKFISIQTNSPEKFVRTIESIYADSEKVVYEDINLKNGKIFSCYSQPQKVDNQVIGRVWLFRDITTKKEIEFQLIKSEQKYRVLLDNLAEMFFLHDLTGRIIDVNKASIDRLGYSKEELLLMRVTDIDKEIIERKDKELIWTLNEGEIKEIEGIHTCKDGSTYNAKIKFNKIKIENVNYITTLVEDITEKKSIERNLFLSEERYRKVFENSSDSIIITRLLDGKIISVNDLFLKDYGYTKEELVGKTTKELHIWKNKEDRDYILNKLNNNEEIKNFEAEFISKNRELWASVSLSTVLLDNIPHVISIFKDITSRKQKDLYRELIDTVFHHLSDIEDFELAISKTISSIKEKTTISAIGIRFQKGNDFPYFIHEGFPNDFIEKDNSVLQTTNGITCVDTRGNPIKECLCGAVLDNTISNTHFGTFWSNDISTIKEIPNYRGTCKDYNYNSIALIPIKKEDTVVGLIQFNHINKNFFNRTVIEYLEQLSLYIGSAFIRNKMMSSKWELEAALYQSQRIESMGILATGIAHDLNNILFPINGLSKLLLNESNPKSMEYESLEQIYKASQRGGQLVKQILSFCDIKNNKVSIRVVSIVHEILKLARAVIPMDIKINSIIDSTLGMILMDPSQIHQILMNLLLNAYQSVEESKGEITLEIKKELLAKRPFDSNYLPEGNYLSIRVSDTGKGIDPKLIHKLFDPYFTTKKKNKGMGLSTIYGIVKENKGDIRVFNEVKGCTFLVYLPIEIEEVVKEENKILLVDDEDPVLFLEKTVLTKNGYKVVATNNSKEALNIFKNDKFDLVILDKNMAYISGQELFRQMLLIKPSLKCIICTGACTKGEELILKRLGVKQILRKPVPIELLLKAVKTTIDDLNEFLTD